MALAVQNRQKGVRNRGAALRMGDIARTPFQGALSVVQSVRMPSILLAGANLRAKASTKIWGDSSCAKSAGANHLPSRDPTSEPSGFLCSRSAVFASSATILLTQYLKYCAHRLDPGVNLLRAYIVVCQSNPLRRCVLSRSGVSSF